MGWGAGIQKLLEKYVPEVWVNSLKHYEKEKAEKFHQLPDTLPNYLGVFRAEELLGSPVTLRTSPIRVNHVQAREESAHPGSRCSEATPQKAQG